MIWTCQNCLLLCLQNCLQNRLQKHRLQNHLQDCLQDRLQRLPLLVICLFRHITGSVQHSCSMLGQVKRLNRLQRLPLLLT